MEDEDGPRAGSEREEHAAYEVVLDHLLGEVVVVGWGLLGRHTYALIVARAAGNSASDDATVPQVFEGEVRGDAEEPAGGMVVVPEEREVLPSPDEGLLTEIIGGLLLTGEAPKICEDVLVVAAKECLELGLSRGGVIIRAGRDDIGDMRVAPLEAIGVRGAGKEESPPQRPRGRSAGRQMCPPCDGDDERGAPPFLPVRCRV